MNVFRRALLRVADRLASLALWEGATRVSRDRGYLHTYVQDPRLDLDQASRHELVGKSRYWEKNDGFCNRLADIWEQYTVGPNGLVYTPASSREDFNALAAEAWNRWSEFPDLASRMTIGQLQSLASYRWFWDGEISLLKTRGESGRPRIQLIECQRIATPDSFRWSDSQLIHDGVRVDRNGRPVSYYIRDGFADDEWVERPAETVIRIFEPSRPGQLRGFPLLSAVLNTIQDLDELQLLEMRAAKSAARQVWAVKRKGGSFDPAEVRRSRLNVPGSTSTGAPTTEQRDAYYRKALGGETVAMEPDEEMNLFTSSRPSVASQEYWDYLISRICAGTGIPKLLVTPRSMQGTVTRADLDVAAAFFRSRSSVLIAAFRRVYEYVIGSELQTNVRLARVAPPDWMRVTVRPPRAVNVDVGRNTTAMVSELEAGALTYETVIGDAGEDWRSYLRQRAKERAYIHELATEYNLDPQEIAGLKQMPQVADPDSQAQTAIAA